MLCGLVGAGLAYDVGGAWSRRSDGVRGMGQGGLEALERRLGQGGDEVGLWRRYADQLREARRYADAARAYEMALKADPVNREMQFLLAQMLVQTGDRDRLYACVTDLALTDPQLVFDVLDRQESKACLEEERFRRLHEETRAQYLD
jgi:predicted Zn-dependent protease